jgi:hypothetical protein
MGNPIQDVLKQSQKSWVLLTQTTVWVGGAIAAFLLPPPGGLPEESRVWVRFAQFVITVVIGMVLLATLRWKRKQDMLRWGGLSMLFLFLGTAAFFSYQILSAKWIASYNGRPVLIGGSYTSLGREDHEANPRLSPEDLVMRFAGQVEKIWTRESLQQRRLVLAAIYVLAMPLFTICIMSIVQALQCAVAKTKSRKRAPAPTVRASH